MSGHSRASDLGQPQKGVSFDGRFLTFASGTPQNNISGFGKGALAIDKASGILYINQGNSTFANWTKVQGGSYMSDIAGVAPMMYEQNARVLVVGDSIHNPTQGIPGGYAPLTNWYMRRWRPNKWCGGLSILNAGGPQAGFNGSPGSECTKTILQMGTNNGLYQDMKYNILQPAYLVTGFNNPPDGTIDFSTTRNLGSIQTTSANFPNEVGDLVTYYFSLKQPELSGMFVGRDQVFGESTDTSERWYNKPGSVLTNKTLWYRNPNDVNYGTDLTCKASGFYGAAGTSTASLTLSGEWSATTLSTNVQASDTMGNNCYFEYAASSGTSQNAKFFPVFSFIENEGITDGMVIAYHGSGGASWASYGILDDGSGNPVEPPHDSDSGNAWATDAATQEMLKLFKPNIIYYSLYNDSADDGYDEATYIERAIARMRANLDATSGTTGNTANDVKIIVVTNYGKNLPSETPIWENRAYRVLNLAKANNYSTIDMYHKLRDNDIVPRASDDNPELVWLADNNHPGPHLSKIFADFVWEEIANTALTGA